MFVDIHSHKHPTDNNSIVIYNVPISQAEVVFSSDIKGFFSIGFHPWSTDIFSAELQEKMSHWIQDKRVIAIGECGLDKHSQVSLDKQTDIFEKQVRMSESIRKPLIIHCVGRFNELIDLKKRWNPAQQWIIHGFRGKPQLAEQALKAGIALSFGEHFNAESVKITPIESLFIETDESNIAVEEIYLKIAQIKNCPVESLSAGEKLISERM